MSVRRRDERDPKTGRVYKVWMVDINFNHADGRRQRVKCKSPVQTRQGAQEYERQIRGQLLAGTYGRQEDMPFREFARQFEEVYVTAELKHATQLTYASTIRVHLIPEFGRMALLDITGRKIALFKAKLSVGRKKHTVRNTLGVLSRMLNVAKQWGYLRHVPEFSFPKVPTPSFRFLSEQECRELLTHAGRYWYAPIYFALKTGCRQGELWPMERSQIDLVNGLVHIDQAVYRGVVGLPKHDKTRTIELSPGLARFLREHLRVVPLKGSLVFPTIDGRMRNERKADKGLRRAASRAKLAPFGWHVLRHSFASNLVSKAVPLQVVQQLLGHSRIDETMRYAHLSPHMKRDAVALLDEMDENHGPGWPEDGPTTEAVG